MNEQCGFARSKADRDFLRMFGIEVEVVKQIDLDASKAAVQYLSSIGMAFDGSNWVKPVQEEKKTVRIPKIVFLAGRKEVGKNTIADILTDRYGYKQAAFADALRETVADWVACPSHNPPSSSPKEVFELLRKVRKDYESRPWPASALEFIRSKPYSPELRRLLQLAGTEVFRSIDKYYWIKSLRFDPDEKYVVTDCRFPDEAEYGKSVGALVLKVVGGEESGDQHASEVEVDKIVPHFTFINLKERGLEHLARSIASTFDAGFVFDGQEVEVELP